MQDINALNNLINHQFGALTVKEVVKAKNGKYTLKCQCKCGEYINVGRYQLERREIISCGKEECAQKAKYGDLTGKHFGYLTVLDLIKVPNKKGSFWKCQCVCGNIIEVSSNSLQKGNTKSCGCLKSLGEARIAQFLNARHYNFKREYSFSDLKDIALLRYDFAIINNQNDIMCLIEYDGEQHYNPNMTGIFTNTYNDIHRRDLLKDEYCKKNKIPLYRIRYDENIELRLEEIINEL